MNVGPERDAWEKRFSEVSTYIVFWFPPNISDAENINKLMDYLESPKFRNKIIVGLDIDHPLYETISRILTLFKFDSSNLVGSLDEVVGIIIKKTQSQAAV